MNNGYVPPHRVVSRPVTPEDFQRVFDDGVKMYAMCWMTFGINKSAHAIAHPQIEKKDPLRFFIDKHGDVYINPVVTRHSSTARPKEEGCMSFPFMKARRVPRYYRLEVEYWTFDEDKPELTLIGPLKKELKGLQAEIWQHELDHLDAKYVFPYVAGEGQNEEGILYKDGWAIPVTDLEKAEYIAKLETEKVAGATTGEPAA